jgi:hypothetical protein
LIIMNAIIHSRNPATSPKDGSMVLLTMTASLVEALERLPSAGEGSKPQGEDIVGLEAEHVAPTLQPPAPSLDTPAVGKPISHGQILDIYNTLKQTDNPLSLESLLVGAKVYVPPPPPKPEPVSPSAIPDVILQY